MFFDGGVINAAAHRVVADDFAVFNDGINHRAHPVVAAVFAQVFHAARPLFARLQRAPQVFKGGCRHVRVAQDVVRLADELFFFPAARFDEGQVNAGDEAFGIGAREDHHRVGEVELVIGHVHAALVAVKIGEVVGFGLAGRLFHIRNRVHGFPLFFRDVARFLGTGWRDDCLY